MAMERISEILRKIRVERISEILRKIREVGKNFRNIEKNKRSSEYNKYLIAFAYFCKDYVQYSLYSYAYKSFHWKVVLFEFFPHANNFGQKNHQLGSTVKCLNIFYITSDIL